MRVCAAENCDLDLDALGLRKDALYCSRLHKDEQRHREALRRKQAKARRDRRTRGLTVTVKRAIEANRRGIIEFFGASEEDAAYFAEFMVIEAMTTSTRAEHLRRAAL